MSAEHVDVLVIGAGISGICAAYYLQTQCPDRTFAVLEARDQLGGTWDLFRYPGVRSDSDMHTLGYAFHPWRDPEAIADGPAILAYLHEVVEAHGLERWLRYGVRVERCAWSSDTRLWTVEARRGDARVTYTCRFLWACTGYYRYDEGYTPDFPGRERFRGQVVHPQRWPEDLDYTDRRVVVIGSGATAVTLVPAMAAEAAHVTMLQRSPTYILSRPREDALAERLRAVLPERAAGALVRWKNVLLALVMFQASRRFPRRVRAMLRKEVREALGDGHDHAIDRHFNPRYEPWDQRLCLVPDGDLFEAIRAGDASVVTDHIEAFTEEGIALRSGATLEADLIVTATGLQLQLMGGARMAVDGAPVDPAQTMMYKGTMLSGVPNFALSLGYTNASWTLKCELIARYITRLLNHMRDHGHTLCCPQPRRDDVEARPLIDLSSGYLTRARDLLPKQGSRLPWRLYQNYVLDRWLLARGRVLDPELTLS